jgi:TRAP-type C4-dicarboxylate transport system substrate-binding protein
MATLAPAGTEWADAALDSARRIREETGGRVSVQWYLGAVMGDEPTMLERIQEGALDGGVFSMVGLIREVPPMALLGLPFLFQNETEAREVFQRLSSSFRERFLQKDLELLGIFSLGAGRLFTTKSASGIGEILDLRTWIWTGDLIGERIFRSLGFRNQVPLEMTDVLPALQYDLLDAFSGTCYSISVLQWFPYARYEIPLDWAYTFGGVLAGKDAFSRISPVDRETFQRVVEQMLRDVEQESRINEQEARRVLKSTQGMREIELSVEDRSRLEERASALYGDLARDIREEDLFRSIRQSLEAMRKGSGEAVNRRTKPSDKGGPDASPRQLQR